MFVFPSREAFIVMVRDESKPRGHRAPCKDQYFKNKSDAEKCFEAQKKLYSNVKVTMSECLI